MKHLIVLAHPDPHSLSTTYACEVARLTEERGNEALIRDLYNIGFHPVLSAEELYHHADCNGTVPPDVKLEQEYIARADLITWIYPIWWNGMPAILKGYIDRVFTRGFAYDIDCNGQLRPLFKGTKTILLNNFGARHQTYEESGIPEAIKKITDTGIFEQCGLQVVKHHFFGHIDRASKEELAGHIALLPYLFCPFLPDNRK